MIFQSAIEMAREILAEIGKLRLLVPVERMNLALHVGFVDVSSLYSLLNELLGFFWAFNPFS